MFGNGVGGVPTQGGAALALGWSTAAPSGRPPVAQAGSLLYRGLAIRKPTEAPNGLPTTSRRYSRMPFCATGARGSRTDQTVRVW